MCFCCMCFNRNHLRRLMLKHRELALKRRKRCGYQLHLRTLLSQIENKTRQKSSDRIWLSGKLASEAAATQSASRSGEAIIMARQKHPGDLPYTQSVGTKKNMLR
jgi:hypothetical protein